MRTDIFKDEIETGAKLLDEYMPGWELSIDVGKLNLESCQTCVLGQCFLAEFNMENQLFGQGEPRRWYSSPYMLGLRVLDVESASQDVGFNLPTWVEELNKGDSCGDSDCCGPVGPLYDLHLHNNESFVNFMWEILTDEWGQFIKDRLDKGVIF